jgi:hypothetical protein
VFCVSTLLPTTGTLLKARAAQEIDSTSLSVSTPGSDVESQAVFARYLDSAVGDINKSKSSVLYCARDLGAELYIDNARDIVSSGLQQELNEELFAQAAVTPLQASIALCGAYGSTKGVQTLGSNLFSHIVSKSLFRLWVETTIKKRESNPNSPPSKKYIEDEEKLARESGNYLMSSSKPKTAKTSGAKTSGAKTSEKKTSGKKTSNKKKGAKKK